MPGADEIFQRLLAPTFILKAVPGRGGQALVLCLGETLGSRPPLRKVTLIHGTFGGEFCFAHSCGFDQAGDAGHGTIGSWPTRHE